MNDPISAEELLKDVKSRCPDIQPYSEDDFDWTWADEGMDLIETEDFEAAELKFLQLIASQPDHPDGYEGLAFVYKATENISYSVILMNEAVRLATILLDKDHIDKEILEEILDNRDKILELNAKQLRDGRPICEEKL